MSENEDDAWGDVPQADRPLWSQYLMDHWPVFPGTYIMQRIAPQLRRGSTRAPQPWVNTARALHAIGFTPKDYYLLAELVKGRFDKLDEVRHSDLFKKWPVGGPHDVPSFHLNIEKWVPWIDLVRLGESPRHALDWVLGERIEVPR